METAIFTLRSANFVLWRLTATLPPPVLIIGRFVPGTPDTFEEILRADFRLLAPFSDLWVVPLSSLDLPGNGHYHYWYEVEDSSPAALGRVAITDPLAYTVDWRISKGDYAASVILVKDDLLLPCDAGGEILRLPDYSGLAELPPNNQLVIYELPTTWTRIRSSGEREVATGSFRDVIALVDPAITGSEALALPVNGIGQSYLADLGVNAIELLPPADTTYDRQWGYGTTNFFAPDFELGFPNEYSWPVASRDFAALVAACHNAGMRFIVDVVMAFAQKNAYLRAATSDFFILDPSKEPNDPDAHNSRGSGLRDGFGSSLFRYARFVNGYDPVTGGAGNYSPARQLLKLNAVRWVKDFNIDGFRLDSVENVASWDFVREFRETARLASKERFDASGQTAAAESRFLVVGEELSEPSGLITTGRLDGLWHEKFKSYIRYAILGQHADDEPSFEWTVRKLIDCRYLGYTDGAQVILYVTSHDVEGYRNERLFNFLNNNGVADTKNRIKLAFACLLTAVGIPMILAGEEFADQHDLFDAAGHVTQNGGKQVDPVNFSRAAEAWRREVLDHVSRLVRFRTGSRALGLNDTAFIHTDFNNGKRVMAWTRGDVTSGDFVVIVANFSDYGTPNAGNTEAEYRVNNWPALPAGKHWREITQDRPVPAEWAGREPVFPWEAKVYTVGV
ncbi:1,4-alpha-glucan branching enzyme [Mucilaginibacter gossypiicola]|uniref:1,4-alpha-glucan branching enzyme n=1 Tax=Mucilaginibacter gossypiicola TaxID=551995 RepID=A0A1H8LSX3_9SPHI|nr:alpha-amylase family glycosyl hydrolase [Mucilaginibacter gossypiicola]SEO08179.1 1,4-alpha-glucan branching enzyme [Mucilaginibacter gossypiicola]